MTHKLFVGMDSTIGTEFCTGIFFPWPHFLQIIQELKFISVQPSREQIQSPALGTPNTLEHFRHSVLLAKIFSPQVGHFQSPSRDLHFTQSLRPLEPKFSSPQNLQFQSDCSYETGRLDRPKISRLSCQSAIGNNRMKFTY